MALIKRVTRLFRADFHAVLDRVEEPDILLRQSMREMEEDIARDERSSKQYDRERDLLVRKESEFRKLLHKLNEELDVCFDANKEDLARSMIRRRLETERSLQLLLRRCEVVDADRERLAQRLDDHHARYESMRQKADLFDERQHPSESADSWSATDVRICEEDVEVALLKERQRRNTQ